MRLSRAIPIIALLAVSASITAHGAEASFSIKLMTPEVALKAAVGAMRACRSAGYQVAVAVVDRTGQTQVVLRDRFAGMHTAETAANKAWTAVSFKMNTTPFSVSTQVDKAASGIRQIPRVVAVGGGVLIDAAGTTFGALGVSGAPSGAADDECARVGVDAILESLELE